MWTETTEGRECIEKVSRYMVTEFAPEELDLFHELMVEYFADPTPPDLTDSGSDDALGSGIGEVLVAVTPAVAAMVTSALSYILTQTAEVVKTESAEKIKEKIKSLLNPENKDKQEDNALQPLSREQLVQVKRLARQHARKFGLEPDLANKMADALVGSIVLAT